MSSVRISYQNSLHVTGQSRTRLVLSEDHEASRLLSCLSGCLRILLAIRFTPAAPFLLVQLAFCENSSFNNQARAYGA